MSDERIAGVLLAAGESKRLGQPKQLLRWHGRALIEHAAQAALDAGLDPVVVVIGSRADDMRAALRSTAVALVENPRWLEGMSTSLQAGLSALPAGAVAAILLLVDQPRVSANHLRALIAAYHASGKPIIVSAFKGRRASPTLFDRSLFDQLMQISGDAGGRSVIQANPDLVEMIEVENELALIDIDTLEDWQRINSG